MSDLRTLHDLFEDELRRRQKRTGAKDISPGSRRRRLGEIR